MTTIVAGASAAAVALVVGLARSHGRTIELLSMANALLPFRFTRGAAASIVLRLPVWRQVLGWNGGIDVTRRAG